VNAIINNNVHLPNINIHHNYIQTEPSLSYETLHKPKKKAFSIFDLELKNDLDTIGNNSCNNSTKSKNDSRVHENPKNNTVNSTESNSPLERDFNNKTRHPANQSLSNLTSHTTSPSNHTIDQQPQESKNGEDQHSHIKINPNTKHFKKLVSTEGPVEIGFYHDPQKEKLKKMLIKSILESEKAKQLLIKYYLLRKQKRIDNLKRDIVRQNKLSYTFPTKASNNSSSTIPPTFSLLEKSTY